MKSILCLAFFCLFLLKPVAAQSYLPGELNGLVQYESAPSPGSITVTATGFGKNKQESIENAGAGTVYTLLFRGIAGSPNTLPMVGNEHEKSTSKAVLSLLNGGYHAFFSQQVLIADIAKKRRQDGVKGRQTTIRVTINTDALRRYLEENNVIRKFGI